MAGNFKQKNAQYDERILTQRNNMKFYETIDRYIDKNIDIYVDMDGVIAEFDIGNFDYDTIVKTIRQQRKK